MATVLSVINYKGGVGKTTITLQLGIGLASLYNKRVLLVDLDPQCSLSLAAMDEHYWADRVENYGSIRDAVQSFYSEELPTIREEWIVPDALNRAWDSVPGNTPGLDLLPSHLDLPDYEMKLVSRKPRSVSSMEEFYLRRNLILRDAIEPLKKKYDFILFDCPPNIYLVSRNAIMASDSYLVPTIPDFISCYGIPFILQHVENMQKEIREMGVRTGAQFLGVVRNRVRFSAGNMVREHEEQSERLARDYPERLLSSTIADRIGVAELLGSRKNIHQEQFSRSSPSFEIQSDFQRLTGEVYKLLQKD